MSKTASNAVSARQKKTAALRAAAAAARERKAVEGNGAEATGPCAQHAASLPLLLLTSRVPRDRSAFAAATAARDLALLDEFVEMLDAAIADRDAVMARLARERDAAVANRAERTEPPERQHQKLGT